MMNPTVWLRQLARDMGLYPCRMPLCASLNTTYGIDPYYSKINRDQTKFWMCERCRFNSALGI